MGALALDGAAVPHLAPTCVVIVEGAPHTARLLRRALEPVASSAVILIDASQPGVDGAEAYRQARSMAPAPARFTIFITSATALELSARGVDGGVLLRAPFEIEHVVALVNDLIG